ncbi:MAG: ABC transporter substrate-binding protein [Alphaproteobacteria bacterium]|nr:ABC transporter substrate-binding protein [Alphaproteobacteria bacterium]
MVRIGCLAASGTGSVRRRRGATAAIATSLLLGLAAWSSSCLAAEKLVLQLSGAPQFEFAGYYAALWQGYYSQAGFEVEIRPGALPGADPVDPARVLAHGDAQFGTGTMQLVLRVAQGLPLSLLAPIFQRSGAAVYYRADADYPSPGALAKARIGRPPASDILSQELISALRSEGVDPAGLHFVPVESGQAVAALADGRVDAAIGSAWTVPWLARQRGLALKSFDPADYRVEFYGDTLFTLQRFAADQPDTVRRFREASLKGWEYAFQHADQIAGRLVAEHHAEMAGPDPAGLARYQAELAARLARYPEVPIGHNNHERWSRIADVLAASGAVPRAPDPAAFVRDLAPENGRADDRRGLLLAGTAAAALLVAAALLWWWWRRPRTAPETAALPQEPEPLPVRPLQTGQQARRFAALGQQIKAALGRTKSGSRPLGPEPAAPLVTPEDTHPPTDLNDILTHLEPVLRLRLPRRATFQFSLLPELWPCRADPAAVSSAIRELVAAAAADLRPGGSLVVGTRNVALDASAAAEIHGGRGGEYARATVRHHGRGLSATALDRIFDPKVSRSPAIAAAREVAVRLGGFAKVESAEGVGTAVHLYFPRVIETRAAMSVAERPAAE